MVSNERVSLDGFYELWRLKGMGSGQSRQGLESFSPCQATTCVLQQVFLLDVLQTRGNDLLERRRRIRTTRLRKRGVRRTGGGRADRARPTSLRLLLVLVPYKCMQRLYAFLWWHFCVVATRKEIYYVELLKRPGQTLGLIVSGAIHASLQF